MRRVLRTALAALLIVQCGCSAANRPSWMQEPGWNKPWTYRSGIAAGICAAVGAGAGVGIQQARTGCATVAQNGVPISQSCTSIGNSSDSTFWVWGALIGAVAGGALCAILGHVFLDPGNEEVAVEAPPPPPEPVATPAPAPPPVKKRVVLRGVNFAFNSSEIAPSARPVLDQAALILQDNPGVTVRVEGFTDSIGSEEYNQALSVRRAEAVFSYLVNRGVDPERFRVEGFGKSRPIASNATEAGRAQNRRVELVPVP
jgi:outer membrane protein OmpA-like peptidoglycan-associated protein